jgi:type IV pilus assembly protein PilW
MKPTPQRRAAAVNLALGLSVVEMMVGLVVGLLVSLAAVSSAQLFTASQRQGIGVGSSSANLASTLASIKADVTNGGLGFFGNMGYLCTKLNLSVNGTVAANNANFAPVQVTRVGTDDVLDIMYGSDVAAGAAVKISGSSDGTTATLRNYLPVTAGQSVLLASTSVGTPCVLRTVTTTPAAPTATVKEVLTFGSTGQYNQGAFTINPTYPDSSLVTLIGNPVWNRYAVNGGALQMTNVLGGNTVTLLRNVIGFRVEYGVAAAAAASSVLDGSRSPLASWQKPTDVGWGSVDNTNILRIKAVRIGIVTRSAQREKVNSQTNQCEASAAMPVLFGTTITPDVTDWQCYRYRTQIVVAPLRNIIYGL